MNSHDISVRFLNFKKKKKKVVKEKIEDIYVSKELGELVITFITNYVNEILVGTPKVVVNMILPKKKKVVVNREQNPNNLGKCKCCGETKIKSSVVLQI